ncbi:MAG: hypothetical protein ACXWZF_12655 [Actinomycetota bacterium]
MLRRFTEVPASSRVETLRVAGSFGYPYEGIETWGEVPLSAPLPAAGRSVQTNPS